MCAFTQTHKKHGPKKFYRPKTNVGLHRDRQWRMPTLIQRAGFIKKISNEIIDSFNTSAKFTFANKYSQNSIS